MHGRKRGTQMKKNETQELVLAALGIALVYITTMFIKLPNSIGGYLNLGDGFILLFAGFLHPFTAFLVGGIGSALADLTGGYGAYAIATLLIKGIEGGLIALLIRQSARLRFPSYLIGALIMIAGYYVTDSLLNASWIVGLGGIPGNIVQAAAGILIAAAATPLVRKLLKKG